MDECLRGHLFARVFPSLVDERRDDPRQRTPGPKVDAAFLERCEKRPVGSDERVFRGRTCFLNPLRECSLGQANVVVDRGSLGLIRKGRLGAVKEDARLRGLRRRDVLKGSDYE